MTSTLSARKAPYDIDLLPGKTCQIQLRPSSYSRAHTKKSSSQKYDENGNVQLLKLAQDYGICQATTRLLKLKFNVYDFLDDQFLLDQKILQRATRTCMAVRNTYSKALLLQRVLIDFIT